MDTSTIFAKRAKGAFAGMMFFAFTLLSGGLAYSQPNTVTISGTTIIGPPTVCQSALVNMDDSHKGLLIPRVYLNSTVDGVNPVPSPCQSMLVYNLAAAGNGATAVTVGYYYWDGGSPGHWIRLDDASANGLDWHVTGNNIVASNVLGTLNGFPLNLIVNGVRAGHIDFLAYAANSANTYFGYQAGAPGAAYNNTAIGYQALFQNSRGNYNTASGNAALFQNTLGSWNTATGDSALYANTTGIYNTASGALALTNNTTGFANTATGNSALFNSNGNWNTADGSFALLANTSGHDNTAIGDETLKRNISGNYNTATGMGALNSNTLGNDNTAAGAVALGSNTKGIRNTADGDSALFHNTVGSDNTASGKSALHFNTNASHNVAVGKDALYSQSWGNTDTAWSSDNVAVGYQALYTNNPSSVNGRNGDRNTAVGTQALYSNTTGYFNVANGAGSLYTNSRGYYNTANGISAMYYNTTGYYNAAYGSDALWSNSTGDSNVSLGHGSLFNNTTGSNNIGIGVNSGSTVTTGSNVICIGNGIAGGNTSSRTYVANIYNTAGSSGQTVLVDPYGMLYTTQGSSRRFKTDIADMGDVSSDLYALRPVTFRYKEEFSHGDRSLQYGLIAEEVKAAIPNLVAYDKDGVINGVKYQNLTPLMLNELQKEHKLNLEQSATIQSLQEQISALKAQNIALSSGGATLKLALDLVQAKLQSLASKVDAMGSQAMSAK